MGRYFVDDAWKTTSLNPFRLHQKVFGFSWTRKWVSQPFKNKNLNLLVLRWMRNISSSLGFYMENCGSWVFNSWYLISNKLISFHRSQLSATWCSAAGCHRGPKLELYNCKTSWNCKCCSNANTWNLLIISPQYHLHLRKVQSISESEVKSLSEVKNRITSEVWRPLSLPLSITLYTVNQFY